MNEKKASRTSGNFYLTENMLKVIACLAMLCDHIPKVMGIGGLPYAVMSQVIGRIAFPLFCFFLVEGFFHTQKLGAYLGRLLLLAVLSEIPYDLALHDRLLEFGNQNAVFTLFLGLLLLTAVAEIPVLARWQDALLTGSSGSQAWKQVPASLIVPALFCLLAAILHLDYGWSGILCIYVLFCLHGRMSPASALLFGCIALNLDLFSDPGAFLAVPFVFAYSGKRGSRKLKWGFYLFYPLHLFLLFLLSAI
ncbi:MAG: TraX family protein [Eubacterium sp.]|nr:TraX family protein [Eubacterium sp.]